MVGGGETDEQDHSIGKYVSLLLQISAVRLPREPSNPERLKGFGYAEFEDLDSLLSALSLNEEVKKRKEGGELEGLGANQS